MDAADAAPAPVEERDPEHNHHGCLAVRTSLPRCALGAGGGSSLAGSSAQQQSNPTVALAFDSGDSFVGLARLLKSVFIDHVMECASPYADEASCGSPRWIGRGLSCVCIKRKGAYERICMNLTPAQEERLQRLKHRMKVYFDPSRGDHQVKFLPEEQ
ncbi:hypothetical protein U9M48_002956 [Paspalum notatum var. saurae]|uniref:Uncharacterized protein n=1 Tax=Paspalum notatum var. saurae TaxID=547442 RepID=A0AAQ3PQ69_PASNO